MLAKNSRNYNRLLTFVHDLSIVHMCPWTNGPTSMTAKPTKVPVRRRALLLRINRCRPRVGRWPEFEHRLRD